ncbi:hypothetical protein WICPIJ_009616 [Wickerhamomyces pijperi]|uniref:Uncharacterized protein n=1 Tax=Wickerhamomyces pijperi TaxID=599730 RepID=A0A9P8PLC2_WICPI|nr:hypothetical protein WICPIJ_009616 [Wickerhamomyces pijperi]
MEDNFLSKNSNELTLADSSFKYNNISLELNLGSKKKLSIVTEFNNTDLMYMSCVSLTSSSEPGIKELQPFN